MKRLKITALFLSLFLLVLFCGCSLVDKLRGKDSEKTPAIELAPEEEQDSEYPVEAGGITLLGRPGKVVSLAPALTEKLFDLGADDRLTGVSDYCDYPGWVEDLPECGTAQIPDVERILELDPHLVLSESALPEDAQRQLEGAGIPVAVFPHAESISDLMETYQELALLMEGETLGELIGNAVTGEFRSELEELSRTLSAHTTSEGRKKVLYLRLMDFTVATGDTFEQELFSNLYMDNIALGYTDWDYPAEEANSADGKAVFASVDVIFMDDRFVRITDLESSEFYKALPAVMQDRYLYISSLVLERQSTRLLDEMRYMASYVYPDAAISGVNPAFVESETEDGWEMDEAEEEIAMDDE